MAWPPGTTIVSPETQVLRRTPSGQVLEKRQAFTCKNNMAGLPGFREPDGNRPGRCVEVGNAHPDQLAVAATGHQRAANQIPKPALRGVDEALAFGIAQIMDHRRIGLAKWLNLAPCLQT